MLIYSVSLSIYPPPPLYVDIPLKEGTNPINLRPYRYSADQKNVVDKLVQDMLSRGIIQHINSAFASPILLRIGFQSHAPRISWMN